MSGVLSFMVAGAGLQARADGVLHYGAIGGAGTATTTTCTITATGGSGSYTYAWTRTSGDASTSISSATAAIVTWSRTFGAVSVVDSYWQCVVTDVSSGASVTVSGIHAQLERA